MTNFPIDVIGDILSRLPVKSLLRFRCVSNPWRALIDGPHFIKLHLNRSIDTKNHHYLLLRRDDNLYSIDFDSLDRAGNLDHPKKSTSVGTRIVGSSHGLVCLCNATEDRLAIWNPSTRKYREIPMVNSRLECIRPWQYLTYGFGFDSVSGDYKAVRILENHGKLGVNVYSMKSNSWRKIQDCPYYPFSQWVYGVLAHGALHFVISESPELDPAVVAVDLAHEGYQLVPRLEFAEHYPNWMLAVLEDSLCIVCNYVRVRVDVWVMREYGVKESWSKLFSIAQPEVIRLFDLVMPVLYSKEGSEILLVQDHKKFLWYNIQQKTVKRRKVLDLPRDFETIPCVESLVPLDGGAKTSRKKQHGQENQQQPKKQQNNGRKKRDDFLSKGFKLVL